MSAGELVGEARVLDIADRWRRLGAGAIRPYRLHNECVKAFQRGEIAFDQVTRLYRHAMIHAGALAPRDRPRFHLCPECQVTLDIPADN